MEASVIAGFERQKQAARAERERAEAARAEAAEAAQRAAEAEERERNHREATRLLKLGTRRPQQARASSSGGVARARGGNDGGGGRSSSSKRKESVDQRDRKRERAQREGRNPVREENSQKDVAKTRVSRTNPRKKSPKPRHDPSKPLPGMEFVERRHKTKPVVVPSTLDYSDMFPESLIGSEIEALTKSRAATAAAAEANERIYEEKCKMHDELQRVAKLDKKDNGRRASEITWVAVDTPTALAERGLTGKSTLAKTDASSARPLSKKAQAEVVRKQLSEATAARSKALLDLIKEANGASSGSLLTPERKKLAPPAVEKPASPRIRTHKRPREHSEHDLLSRKRKRRHSVHDDDSDISDERSVRRRADIYSDGPSESDSNDDDDDDDDDDDIGTGFEALQAEERRSAKIAAREDKREKLRLEKAKLEKQRRRLEWEKGRGVR